MARVELKGMTLRQLLDLREKVEAEISQKQVSERAEAKRALAELAEKRGFSLDELFGVRKGKGLAAIKYRNPDNPAETWVGRGRKPTWLVDKLKKGGKLESFEI